MNGGRRERLGCFDFPRLSTSRLAYRLNCGRRPIVRSLDPVLLQKIINSTTEAWFLWSLLLAIGPWPTHLAAWHPIVECFATSICLRNERIRRRAGLLSWFVYFLLSQVFQGPLLHAQDWRPVPDLDDPVVVAGCDPVAVGAERHPPDITIMPLEGEQLLAILDIPDLEGLISPT